MNTWDFVNFQILTLYDIRLYSLMSFPLLLCRCVVAFLFCCSCGFIIYSLVKCSIGICIHEYTSRFVQLLHFSNTARTSTTIQKQQSYTFYYSINYVLNRFDRHTSSEMSFQFVRLYSILFPLFTVIYCSFVYFFVHLSQ